MKDYFDKSFFAEDPIAFLRATIDAGGSMSGKIAIGQPADFLEISPEELADQLGIQPEEFAQFREKFDHTLRAIEPKILH